MKMKRREAGHTGEILQGKRLVQVALDVHQRAHHALVVGFQRRSPCHACLTLLASRSQPTGIEMAGYIR